MKKLLLAAVCVTLAIPAHATTINGFTNDLPKYTGKVPKPKGTSGGGVTVGSPGPGIYTNTPPKANVPVPKGK